MFEKISLFVQTDWDEILKQEENYIRDLCSHIIALKPTLVMTEKGVSDLAQHFLGKAGITVLRRLRKTDNNRVARAVGATIVNQPASIKETDVGTGCGLFEVRKIGDEYFTYLVECKNPKACTIMLRGASKGRVPSSLSSPHRLLSLDVLNEIERNLLDAMNVVRNLVGKKTCEETTEGCEETTLGSTRLSLRRFRLSNLASFREAELRRWRWPRR